MGGVDVVEYNGHCYNSNIVDEDEQWAAHDCGCQFRGIFAACNCICEQTTINIQY